jgi:2-keto-4-pentenoate hydratase
MHFQRGPHGAPYTELDVAKAIRKMIPVIEVVGTRFAPIPAPGKPLPPIALLSDLGGAHAVIKSNHQHKHWQDFALDQVSVQVTVNGQLRAQGTGADVLGHPIKALTWLINYLGARNIIVPKESFIITGTCTGLTPVQPGDKVVVEFSDNIGNIEVQME